MTSAETMFSKIRNSIWNKERNQTNGPNQSRSRSQSGREVAESALPERNSYHRPSFLALSKSEETECLDVEKRLIITAKDEKKLPLGAGYAECVNGGKSSKNEDQAAVSRFRILNHPDGQRDHTKELKEIDVHYFAIFDGHAGPGAALMAADQLINHLQEKLFNIQENIFSLLHESESESVDSNKLTITSLSHITIDDLVIGALEAAFFSFDEQIATERTSFSISGGCAAVAVIILQGKLYVAHAGDCRAVAYIGDEIHEMAVEFTPETDSQRIQSLAFMNPALTHDVFTDKVFQKYLNKRDIGSKVLFKAANHKGWQSMIVTEAELKKSPLVIGQRKWAKLMGIIGVARGFGDHDLTVPNTDIRVKPFLTPLPEVRILNLADRTLHSNDVLVMGCDGLWDLLSNEEIKTTTRASLDASQGDHSLPCYNKAAESVVHLARGDNNGRGWKMVNGSDASFDDICAFVIPLHSLCHMKKENSDTSDHDFSPSHQDSSTCTSNQDSCTLSQDSSTCTSNQDTSTLSQDSSTIVSSL